MNTKWFFALFCAAVSSGVVTIGAQRLPLLPDGVALALTNARIVDVRRGTLTPSSTLVVRDGRIESIRQTAPPAGARVLDLNDSYVLPGLIDAHAHVATLEAAQRALTSGVTTIRTAGVSAFQDVALRELAKQAPISVPDIFAAGVFLRPELPLDVFLASPADWTLESGLRESGAVLRAVRMNLSRKVDWIKILVTEGVGGDPDKLQFTEADIAAAVKVATTSRIPVAAHAFGDRGVRVAVEAGVRSIEHGGLMSETTLDLMKQRGTFFVPTGGRL